MRRYQFLKAGYAPRRQTDRQSVSQSISQSVSQSISQSVSQSVRDVLFAHLQFVGHPVAILLSERFTSEIMVPSSAIRFILNFVTISKLVHRFKKKITHHTQQGDFIRQSCIKTHACSPHAAGRFYRKTFFLFKQWLIKQSRQSCERL